MTIAENEIDDFYTFLEPRLQKDDPSTITSNDGTSFTHPTDSVKGEDNESISNKLRNKSRE